MQAKGRARQKAISWTHLSTRAALGDASQPEHRSPGLRWLITQFIDKRPRFRFVVEGETSRGGIPFDMFAPSSHTRVGAPSRL